MLERFQATGFKSLLDVEIELPRLLVLFGPNAAGKSNVLDAVQVLSRLATERTLDEALSPPMRGYPTEAFSLPSGGLPELLEKDEATFTLEADIGPEYEDETRLDPLRYRATVLVEPAGGVLRVEDEYLSRLDRDRDPKYNARIERDDEELVIRRKERGQPRREPVGLNHTKLSDPRLSGSHYPHLERMRSELAGWRTYYLDPRIAMRRPQPPREVQDIGPQGENLAAFLYGLKNDSEHEDRFDAVVRVLRSVIPSVDEVAVNLDKKRGELDLEIVQNGTPFSGRVISEGTLRVMALCAIAVNPWPGSLVAFEEPENGVHPRRLEIIADVLTSMAIEGERQVIVTTHSPKFAGMMVKKQREYPEQVGLVECGNESGRTILREFEPSGPLFEDEEIQQVLTDDSEDGLFDAMMMRGWVGA